MAQDIGLTHKCRSPFAHFCREPSLGPPWNWMLVAFVTLPFSQRGF